MGQYPGTCPYLTFFLRLNTLSKNFRKDSVPVNQLTRAETSEDLKTDRQSRTCWTDGVEQIGVNLMVDLNRERARVSFWPRDKNSYSTGY